MVQAKTGKDRRAALTGCGLTRQRTSELLLRLSVTVPTSLPAATLPEVRLKESIYYRCALPLPVPVPAYPFPTQLEPVGYANQTAPQMLFDAAHSQLFVSVARTGAVHTIELKMLTQAVTAGNATALPTAATASEFRLVRSVMVGGSPGAMTLAYMPGVAPPTAAA